MARGFKLQTTTLRNGEFKMAFTCTKSGKSYFHKMAKPEDKVYCPFSVVYKQYKKPSTSEDYDYDDGFFYLHRYKSFHNHELDTALA